jgi:hypothetical protein
VSVFLFLLASESVAFAQRIDADRPTEGHGLSLKILSTAGADKQPPPGEGVPQTVDLPSICQMIESAAAANGLPLDFVTRVIWQESHFKSDAVGPVTRSGQRAQGIAQFMSATAAERLLRDPFDPVQALPKSAEYLSELRAQFGNLGLAAAAYNAGAQRVRDWIAGSRTLPSQTQTYVRMVTGRTAEAWLGPQPAIANLAIPPAMPCGQMAKSPANPATPARVAQGKPISPWIVQLIGDRSEINALASYRQLQRKHLTLLGNYKPVVMRTTLRGGTVAIWSRVRIVSDSRLAAETVCSKLRMVGENCLVQRN